LRKLRQHGWDVKNEKFVNHDIGINSRMDAIQAVVLKAKLPHLDGWVKETQEVAEAYDVHLNVGVPKVPYGHRSHSYHLYTIRHGDRDRLQQKLKEAGVASDVYFPITMVDQPVFASHYQHVPEATLATFEILSLPIYPGLTVDEQKHVIDTVNANV
jgi:dTDP-4-amino-4,6-dideoxygalactose transaminase